MSAVAFETISKSYGTFEAVRHVSFELEPGMLGVLVGPSGCGKSTLLSLAAGLERASRGHVSVDGRQVSGIAPNVALIFQNYNLFPWATARDNVAFGLEMSGAGRRKALARADELLADVGLGAFAERLPSELSGGMKQRVALARALALKPRLILMDEPFAALDYQTRRAMQRYLLDTNRRTGATILLVTHDLIEALTLADRLIVFSGSPGTVADVVDLVSDHPRDLADPDVSKLKRELERRLENDSQDVDALVGSAQA